jgi:hypothetical protein
MRSHIQVAYDPLQDAFVGATTVHTAIGMLPVFAIVPLRPIGKAAARVLLEKEVKKVRGTSNDEVGFGFLKKAWNKVWSKAKKVARAVGVTKVLNAVKKGALKTLKAAGKIVKSPAFGALMGVASFIPGVGPIALAGYAGVRAAIAIAEGAKKGDPKALETIGKYAMPGGEKTMALIRSVVPGQI